MSNVDWFLNPSAPTPMLVRLANGAPFPLRAAARTAVGDGPTVTISVAVEHGRPVMVNFSVGRQPGGSPVTARFIHSLPVDSLFEQLVGYLGQGALLAQMELDDPGGVHLVPTLDEWRGAGRPVASRRGRPVGDEDLQKAVEIYRANKYDFREQMRGQLGISTRTASRWIAMAKERGLLTDETTEEDHNG